MGNFNGDEVDDKVGGAGLLAPPVWDFSVVAGCRIGTYIRRGWIILIEYIDYIIIGYCDLFIRAYCKRCLINNKA